MYKFLIIGATTLCLAGCNSTVYDNGIYAPRPVVDVYSSPSPVYYPAPIPRPYYVAPNQRSVFVHTRNRCFTTWDRTPRGYVERILCGNHIP